MRQSWTRLRSQFARSSQRPLFVSLVGIKARFPSGTLLPLLFWGFFIKPE